MSCNICADTYNKSTRICIACPYCSFEVCRTCCETYILSEPNPRCMNPDCYKEWSRKFLRDHFTLVFLTKRYRPHMEEVLFDKEKALLPAAQPIIEEKNRKKRVREQIQEVEKEMTKLYLKKNSLEAEYHNREEPTKKERSAFVRQCPAEGCRGFLSTQWKCGICELWTCPECHELKGSTRDGEHTCDPNNVQTAQMLAKDSKPCPSCHSMIFKISGCNQMFCTQCNTAFSWTTGEINTTGIHNPHYFEWLRNNPQAAAAATYGGDHHGGGGGGGGGARRRDEMDMTCERELTQNDFQVLLQMCKLHTSLSPILAPEKKTKKYYVGYDYYGGEPGYSYISSSSSSSSSLSSSSLSSEETNERKNLIERFGTIIRSAIHLTRVEVNYFAVTDYIRSNEDLRVAYLEGDLEEEDFKREIQRRDKKNRKNTEIRQIMQFAATACKDVILRLINHLKESPNDQYDFSPFVEEIQGLVTQCNELFKEVSRTYGTVQYALREDFAFIRP
jgi:hypothetical protein